MKKVFQQTLFSCLFHSDGHYEHFPSCIASFSSGNTKDAAAHNWQSKIQLTLMARDLKYQLCRSKHGYKENIIRLQPSLFWNMKNNGIIVYLELPEYTASLTSLLGLILVTELASGRNSTVKCPLRMHAHLACSNEADPRKTSLPIALYPPIHQCVQQRHEISCIPFWMVCKTGNKRSEQSRHEGCLHFRHEELASIKVSDK